MVRFIDLCVIFLELDEPSIVSSDVYQTDRMLYFQASNLEAQVIVTLNTSLKLDSKSIKYNSTISLSGCRL